MFNKRLIALPALLLGLTLVSCHKEPADSSSSESASVGESSTSSSTSTTPSTDTGGDDNPGGDSSDFTPGLAPLPFDEPTFKDPVGSRTPAGKVAASYGNPSLVQKGQENLLVVPVQFLNDAQQYSDTQIESLKSFFFGSRNSVSAYYSKVSNGALNLGGVVGPEGALTLPYTLDTYLAQVSTLGPSGVISEITDYVVTSIFQSYMTKALDWRDFDADGDGVIDGISLVYIHSPADENTTDAAEASLLTAGLVSSPLEGRDNIQVGSVSWSPYDYTSRQSFTDGIYESLVGSMLGIPSLTDSVGDSTTGYYRSPMGFTDIMDTYYLTDQSSFAKYLMGWIDPTVYTASDIDAEGLKVTLRPSESTGDAIILSPTGSESPFGEYLIVDFYTPTGYNANTIGINTMTTPGVRVLKVDSRLARQQSAHWYLTGEEDPDFSDGAVYDYAFTNNAINNHYSDGITENFPLCEILDDSAFNRHVTGDTPILTSDALFQQGEGFGDGNVPLSNRLFYGDFAFDGDGNPLTAPTLGITFTVDSVTSDSATITLRRSK